MFTQSTENQMKFKYLAVLVFFVASAFGAARAQNVKGVVYGADTDEPLIGASVYWPERRWEPVPMPKEIIPYTGLRDTIAGRRLRPGYLRTAN